MMRNMPATMCFAALCMAAAILAGTAAAALGGDSDTLWVAIDNEGNPRTLTVPPAPAVRRALPLSTLPDVVTTIMFETDAEGREIATCRVVEGWGVSDDDKAKGGVDP